MTDFKHLDLNVLVSKVEVFGDNDIDDFPIVQLLMRQCARPSRFVETDRCYLGMNVATLRRGQ